MRQIKNSLVLMGLLLNFACFAQNIPDAGALMRQNEQMFKQNQFQRIQQNHLALPPEMVFIDGVSITVTRFQFNGNKLITSEQLQTLAKPFVNRTLSPQELHQLTNDITDSYRQLGLMVQTYIPKQDLSGPELTIQIIENTPSNKSLR